MLNIYNLLSFINVDYIYTVPAQKLFKSYRYYGCKKKEAFEPGGSCVRRKKTLKTEDNS
jgi:hypothetical protein